jgi:hypothetical protein
MKIERLYFFVGFLLLGGACHNTEKTTKVIVTQNPDTVLNSPENGADSLNLNSVLHNYLGAYRDTLKRDTSFLSEGQILRVTFKHYCTFDSLVLIPEKYVRIYGLKSFKTHDFQSSLQIVFGGKIVIDTIIKKVMFRNLLNDEEVKYGTLLYPVINFGSKSTIIDYSISVPLTDVGVGGTLECRYDGQIEVRKN